MKQSLLLVSFILCALFTPNTAYAQENIYPILTYGVSGSDTEITELQSLGVNTFILGEIFSFDEASLTRVTTILDKAQQHRMKVVLTLFVPLQHPSLFSTLPSFINQVRDHPALYGYYLMDEPELYDFVTPENFKLLNDTIKLADPHHHTFVVFSAYLDRALPYLGIADIEGFDLYPFAPLDTTTQENKNLYTQKLNEFSNLHTTLVTNNTRAYFAVVQAFTDQYRREPTFLELQEFIENNIALEPLTQGYIYYTYNTAESGAHGFKDLLNLQNTITQLNQINQHRASTVGFSYLMGDLDYNNTVNIFDYNLLVASFGHPYTIFDYNQLVANFGKSL